MVKIKRKSIWDNDNNPYGTYIGEKGNPKQWKKAFQDKYTFEESVIINDCNDPYAVLGISELLTMEEIKSAYRKLMLIHHPDKGGNAEKCKKIIYSLHRQCGIGWHFCFCSGFWSCCCPRCC